MEATTVVKNRSSLKKPRFLQVQITGMHLKLTNVRIRLKLKTPLKKFMVFELSVLLLKSARVA